MGRAKKPKYEYVKSLKRYRKRVKDSDGKYIALYGKTKAELENKISVFNKELEDGITDRSNPLISDYANRWLNLKIKNKKIGAGTASDYSYIIRNFISAPLAGRRIADVNASDIQDAVSVAAAKSNSVSRKTIMIIKAIFDAALDDGLISRSPCIKLKATGNEAKERTALTDDQVKTLLEATEGTRCHTFCMIAIYAGMRREEILGLRWESVQLNKAPYYIDVKQALHWEHNRPVVNDKLKTKDAYRKITIPPQLVEHLKVIKGRKKAGFVICDDKGEPLTETQWRNVWNTVVRRTVKPRTYYRYVDGKKTAHTVTPKLGERAAHNKDVVYSIDFEVTPHMLRHTYVTNLLAAGIDPKTVQYLAGHKLSRMTMEIYGHLKYNRPEDLAKLTDAAFKQ